MVIFIDGYNILRGAGYCYYQNNKSFFISACVTYARRKGHKIILVFDGGSWTSPVSDHIKGVCEVIETGIGLSADDYLITRIQKFNHPDKVLVTADRGIISALASCPVVVIEPSLFCTFLSSPEQEGSKKGDSKTVLPILLHGDSDLEFDDFMKRITTHVYTKDETFVTLKNNNKARTASKKERALKKILSKL